MDPGSADIAGVTPRTLSHVGTTLFFSLAASIAKRRSAPLPEGIRPRYVEKNILLEERNLVSVHAWVEGRVTGGTRCAGIATGRRRGRVHGTHFAYTSVARWRDR